MPVGIGEIFDAFFLVLLAAAPIRAVTFGAFGGVGAAASTTNGSAVEVGCKATTKSIVKAVVSSSILARGMGFMTIFLSFLTGLSNRPAIR